MVTQTIRVTLEPRMFVDQDEHPLELLIDARDEAATADSGEVPLDAPG